ncbi:hypothetical protein B0T19DRAFT_102094 [Cercophora scortea]|uniref:Uncharacterized protein n=1 Tax=Cercophora scortea TaxID=314031 RepID=A0AAE0IW71_9PEZI|nr:hypothetical protein B0T19DRAFT_102094 [Cercophora scortea]
MSLLVRLDVVGRAFLTGLLLISYLFYLRFIYTASLVFLGFFALLLPSILAGEGGVVNGIIMTAAGKHGMEWYPIYFPLFCLFLRLPWLVGCLFYSGLSSLFRRFYLQWAFERVLLVSLCALYGWTVIVRGARRDRVRDRRKAKGGERKTKYPLY